MEIYVLIEIGKQTELQLKLDERKMYTTILDFVRKRKLQ